MLLCRARGRGVLGWGRGGPGGAPLLSALVPLACRPCVLAASVFSAAQSPAGGVWVDGQAPLTVTAVTCELRFVSLRAVNDIDLTACSRLIYCNCKLISMKIY